MSIVAPSTSTARRALFKLWCTNRTATKTIKALLLTFSDRIVNFNNDNNPIFCLCTPFVGEWEGGNKMNTLKMKKKGQKYLFDSIASDSAALYCPNTELSNFETEESVVRGTYRFFFVSLPYSLCYCVVSPHHGNKDPLSLSFLLSLLCATIIRFLLLRAYSYFSYLSLSLSLCSVLCVG
jgi:hypothetical protein